MTLSGGSGGPLTDRTAVSYNNGTRTSTYHIYAAGLDWSRSVGLLVYGDGSGEQGLASPSSTYLMAGTNGLIAVAKRHNMILVTPRAPGNGCTDGDGVCWYLGSNDGTTRAQKTQWLDDLIKTQVLPLYNIERTRVCIAGFSSGAENSVGIYGPANAASWMEDGLLLAISYGSSPAQYGVTNTYTVSFRANVAVVWDVRAGDETTAVEDSLEGFDWYVAAGFATTDRNVIAGGEHDRPGEFGTIVDTYVTEHVLPATATGGSSAVTFRAASDDARGTATNGTPAVPAGTVAGDLLIAVHASDTAGSLAGMPTPSGWTEVGSSSRNDVGFVKVYTRTAGGSEPATYTFTDETDASSCAVILATYNHNSSAPLAVVPTFANGAAATAHTAPSVTGVDNGLLVTAHIAGTAGTTRDYTAPTGMATAEESTLTTGGDLLLGVYHQQLSADGATGTRAATASASTPWIAMSLVVAPAATAQTVSATAIPSGEQLGSPTVTLPAKRFYLANTAAGYTPATVRGAWDNTAQAVTRRLTDVEEGANASANVADTSTTNAWDVLAVRFVSEPAVAAGTLSGVAAWAYGALESDTADNLLGHVHAYVTVGSTDAVRGTLVANHVSATEWPVTTAAGRGETNVPLTPVAVQVGDRLVVELGYVANNTTLNNASGVNRNGTIWYGGTGTDLAVDSTAVTTQPGWIDIAGAGPVFTQPVAQTVTATGIASGQAMGVPTVTVPAAPTDQTVTAFGIGSGEQLGVPSVSLASAGGLYPSDDLYPSDALFPSDDTTVPAGRVVEALGIPSGEQLGSPLVQVADGPQTVVATAIDSAEALGVPTVEVIAPPQDVLDAGGIPTAEAIGLPTVTVAVPPPPPFGVQDAVRDTYFIDGVDLTDFAVRIETAEGLQDAPAVLGDDIPLPGRDGAIEVFGGLGQQRRPDSIGRITFQLWLKGVDPDTGRVPGGSSSAAEYFARWDELVRMLYRRRVTIDHPRPDGTRRAVAHLIPGETITPSRTPSSPWFGRFKVTFAIPGAHWHDLNQVTTGTVALASGGSVDLSAFAPATAPCTELRVVFGAGNNPRLSTSYGYLGWNGVIAAGRQLGIDTATGTTDQAGGAAWQPGYSGLTYSPGPRLLEVDPSEPLGATLTHTGGGAMTVEISGRRRYRTS